MLEPAGVKGVSPRQALQRIFKVQQATQWCALEHRKMVLPADVLRPVKP